MAEEEKNLLPLQESANESEEEDLVCAHHTFFYVHSMFAFHFVRRRCLLAAV